MPEHEPEDQQGGLDNGEDETSSTSNSLQALEVAEGDLTVENTNTSLEPGEVILADKILDGGEHVENQLISPDLLRISQEYLGFLVATIGDVLATALTSLISLGTILVSEEQLANAGSLPMTPPRGDKTVLYLRYHRHQNGGSVGTTSVSGPYTWEEVEEEVREELTRRFEQRRNHLLAYKYRG